MPLTGWTHINNYHKGIEYMSIMAPATPNDGSEPEAPIGLPAPTELANRRQHLMTQAEMADLIDVDPGQLSRFERGQGGLAYEKIRRYSQVLNLRLQSADLHQYLLDRIEQRGPLVTLNPDDRLSQALEAMTAQQVGQLPVRLDPGEPVGVLTEVAVCESLAGGEPERALSTKVEELPLEPLDKIRPGDSVRRATALLASHWLVRVVDEDDNTEGYATRRDLFPLILGRSTPGSSARSVTYSS